MHATHTHTHTDMHSLPTHTHTYTLANTESKMERDTFMSAEEAKAFGLIDEVLVHRKTPEATQE